MFDASPLVEYVMQDNVATERVYLSLLRTYRQSLDRYKPSENFIGVFFFECLKLLTGSILRQRELTEHLSIYEPYLHADLPRWPYIGYKDLREGVDVSSKSFLSQTQSSPRVWPQRALETVSRARAAIEKSRLTVGMLNTGLDHDLARHCIQKGWRVSYLGSTRQLVYIPDADLQFDAVRQWLISLHEEQPLPLPPETYEELLRRHCFAFISHRPLARLNIDVLVRGSGVELSNRLCAVSASQQGVPIIGVLHGEGVGLLDEPMFDEMGEPFLAQSIIGYGPEGSPWFTRYVCSLTGEAMRYIQTSSPDIAKRYRGGRIKSFAEFSHPRVCYVPTSLSGTQHRHGPYRDMPDALYLSWHREIAALFDRCTIKYHPKEKYLDQLKERDVSFVTKDLRETLDDIDVFVFDYVSSAFFLAAATDKSIIFLDLGLRRIADDARASIEARTHYVDLQRNPMVDRQALAASLRNASAKRHTITERYSLDECQQPRAFMIVEEIAFLVDQNRRLNHLKREQQPLCTL